MKTLKMIRIAAAVLAEIFIAVAFVDMYMRTGVGALILLMVFFLSSVPFTIYESRKKGTRTELIRHINTGTLYGKAVFYVILSVVSLVAAFIDQEDMLLMFACFFLGAFNAVDSFILYKFRKSID